MKSNNKKFKKIRNWIESKGYSVRFGTYDCVDSNTKEVIIYNNRHSTKHLIYSALHECGHVIMLGDRNNYCRDFKSVIKADCFDGRHYRSNIYKYKKLKEETDAWEKGYSLSKKLGIKINKDEYDNYAARNFITYVKYI